MVSLCIDFDKVTVNVLLYKDEVSSSFDKDPVNLHELGTVKYEHYTCLALGPANYCVFLLVHVQTEPPPRINIPLSTPSSPSYEIPERLTVVESDWPIPRLTAKRGRRGRRK